MNEQVSLKNYFYRSVDLLEKKDKSKLLLVTFVQIGLAILDLIAVTLIGIVTALTLSGIQSKSPPEQIGRILELFGAQDLNFQLQVAILGTLAAVIMVTKTLSSVFLVRRILEFLAFKSALVSVSLTKKVMNQPYEFIKQNSSQSIVYALTQGCNSLVLGVVGSGIQLIVEASLILIMLAGLFIYEPLASMGALLYFGVISLVQQSLLGKRALELGSSGANVKVLANKKIIEALSLYREIYTRQAIGKYSKEIEELMKAAASVTARLNFFPYISKYTLETALVLGALSLAAIQFIVSDAVQAITTLVIFLAAATRVSPALLRVQQSLVGIKANIGAAEPAIDLINAIAIQDRFIGSPRQALPVEHEICLKEVTFIYQKTNVPVIENLNLNINRGQLVAVIGPSGSGKTTLVDLILGLLQPQSGTISIRGKSPQEFVTGAYGTIGYVAQDATLIDGSLRDNLIFGLEKHVEDEDLLKILETVAMREFVESLPNKLNTLVGERGTLLSGGQRQRLNLARALVTNPEILVLDEATSALDVETESVITKSIESLKLNRTIIVIAHRLSTVLNADNIVFMQDGHILGQGHFSELRKTVPDFDRQAQLAGYQE
jgi:ATP-binding cassette subfamily C protein